MLDKLPADLREIDEKQFLELVEWLKNKTEGFKKFPEELFLMNNQLILILRLALGMTRSTFARKVGLNEETLRHVEAGRKKTVPIKEKWSEKVSQFLQSIRSDTLDINKSLSLWRELKLRQLDSKAIDEEIERKLKELNIQDIRKISNEQFIQLFDLLKDKTENFTKFPISLLTTSSNLLFVVRMILRITQKELAKLLGTSKDWVRHTESGVNKVIHVGPASRWCHKIEMLLKEKRNDIDLQKSLLFLRESRFIRREIASSEKRLPIVKLTKEQFIEEFERFRDVTKNFSDLKPEHIEEDPRRILFLRLMLNWSRKTLAKNIGIDRGSVCRWEKGKPIDPFSAVKIVEKIKEEIKDISINEKDVTRKFELLQKRKLRFNFDKVVENGFKLAETGKLNQAEKRVLNVLKEAGIEFAIHKTIEGIKRKLNVDFVIPNEKDPKWIIEVFETSVHIPSRARLRACAIDQRFKQLKLKHPNLKTMMVIFFRRVESENEEIKNSLEKDLIDTDFLIVNEEVEKLPSLIESK